MRVRIKSNTILLVVHPFDSSQNIFNRTVNFDFKQHYTMCIPYFVQ